MAIKLQVIRRQTVQLKTTILLHVLYWDCHSEQSHSIPHYYGDGTSKNGKQQDFFNKMIFPIW